MKITVFNGSPRGKNSNTHVMVKEFLQGAQDAKAEVENIFLGECNIRHCLGCFSCWVKTPGQCVINDGMKELLLKFVSSDIVVFATPVYVDNVTGLMKNFIDRLIPLADPHFEKDAGGECRHIIRQNKSPKIIVISNCGFPEQSHFQVISLSFKRFARNMHSEVIAEIYRGGGAILRDHPLVLEPLFMNYRHILRTAGREVVEDLRLSDKTISLLNKPIISDELYINKANESWDKLLSKK
ncbi:MAG: flavodoxin family protein [Candidatus Omnitrophota bacterium]